jgi:hypothetical protein
VESCQEDSYRSDDSGGKEQRDGYLLHGNGAEHLSEGCLDRGKMGRMLNSLLTFISPYSRYNLKRLIPLETVNLKISIECENSLLIENFSRSNERRVC